ncbi:MAG: SDR family oxidoreductase [Dehalococcoidia bacterium]
MRILVTGGAGFVGSHIVEAYLAAGHEVLVVDNLSAGRRENVPPGAAFWEADIRSPEMEQVFLEFRPEAVNHQAAQASVKVSTADPYHDLDVNGAGTLRVASLAAAAGARFIYASSGGTLYGDPDSVPVPETAPVRPLSPYGVSKFVGETYVQYLGRTAGLRWVILRPGNAYGPRQDPYGEAGVTAIFAGRMLRGEPCTIDGDGEQVKDYVYVKDLARANLMALERGDGEVLNIGTGHGLSVNAIFATLQRATGSTVPPVHGPPRPGDVRRFILDCTRAREVLGWAATTPFDEGIAETVAALRER